MARQFSGWMVGWLGGWAVGWLGGERGQLPTEDRSVDEQLDLVNNFGLLLYAIREPIGSRSMVHAGSV